MKRLFGSLAGASIAAAAVLAPPAFAATQPATWNFSQASVPLAEPLGNYGRGVLVAVVDTWVDFTQPQFSGRVVDEANCLTGTCVDKQYSPDECVHGTHVAGTIASDQYGVAPEADILSVQVLSGPSGSTNQPDAECSGNADSVAAGIEFAANKGAKVINLSLADEVPGLFQSSAISSAVTYAADHNDVVVFAAGNDDLPLTDDYGSDAVIVAATGPSGQLASYSNFNSVATGDVNVAAPGGDTGNSTSCSTSDCILSTFPHNQLGLLQGTSMAAPHVSGLAALLFSQNPSRTAANVISTIEGTAKSLPGAGSGLIDAKAALDVETAAHPPVAGPAPSTPGAGAGAGGGGGGSITPVTTRPPASGSGPVPVDTHPAALSSSPSVTVKQTPPTTAARPGGHPATIVAPSHSSPAVAAGGVRTTGSDGGTSKWASKHAGILVGAGVLLVGDLLALAWTREVRRVFGSAA